MQPALFLLIASVIGHQPDEADQAAWMDMIEERVRLPDGAHALDDYARYYAFDGRRRRLEAVYIFADEPPPEPLPADWGCDELVEVEPDLVWREVPCPPESDSGRDLGAGQRRWLARGKALPFVADGGCSVVHVVFDMRKRRISETYCNGSS